MKQHANVCTNLSHFILDACVLPASLPVFSPHHSQSAPSTFVTCTNQFLLFLVPKSLIHYLTLIREEL